MLYEILENIESVNITTRLRIGNLEETSGTLIRVQKGLIKSDGPTLEIKEKNFTTFCTKNNHIITSVSLYIGCMRIYSYFSGSSIQQEDAFKKIDAVFLALRSKGRVDDDGNINYNNKETITKFNESKDKTEIDNEESFYYPENTYINTVRTHSYIRREGKKPTKKFLLDMRKKIQEIADDTFEPNIPMIEPIIKEEETKSVNLIGYHGEGDLGI